MLLEKYTFEVFADYFQFYLQGEEAKSDWTEQIWTEQSVSDLIAVAEGVINIGTVRNMMVPLTVEIHDCEPQEDESQWQHITESSITAKSKNLIVAGCGDYLPEAARIKVKPDTYRAKIYYGGLNTLSEDGLKGNDFYKVVLWSDNPTETKVIKRFKNVSHKRPFETRKITLTN